MKTAIQFILISVLALVCVGVTAMMAKNGKAGIINAHQIVAHAHHTISIGTPTPSLARMCSGYVVEIGEDVIVFDHGFGAHHRLLEAGIPATRVTHFFCSHLHYDHMGDYPRLLLTRWDQGAGRVPELKVYGPPPIKAVTRALFETGGAFWPDLVARTEHMCSVSIYHARGGVGDRAKPVPAVTEMRPNDIIEGKGWSVKAVGVAHFGPQLTSYGFRFDSPKARSSIRATAGRARRWKGWQRSAT